jgi:hypothetical protein
MNLSWIGGILSVLHIINTNNNDKDPERIHFNIKLLITLFFPFLPFLIAIYEHFKKGEISKYTKILLAFGIFMLGMRSFINLSEPISTPKVISTETEIDYKSNAQNNIYSVKLKKEVSIPKPAIIKNESPSFDELVCNAYQNKNDRISCFEEIDSDKQNNVH